MTTTPGPLPEDGPIPRKQPPKTTKKTPKKAPKKSQSPESRVTAMKLASLAMAWIEQDGRLRVRQREELRRALALAAEFRGWATTGADPIASAVKDVKKLTKAGSEYIAQDLVEEVAGKKTEVSELRVMVDSINEMADTADWEDPIEVTYSHTAREGDGLATRVEIVTLADADGAKDAAATIVKKLDNWEKLRVQMLEDLKQRQRQLKAMEDSIPDFAESSKGVLDDVLAILT